MHFKATLLDWIASSPPSLKLRRIGSGLEGDFTKKAINLAKARLRLFLRSKAQVNLAFSQRKSHQLMLMAFFVAGTGLEPATFGL